jgi:hypothetical protein
MVDQSSAGRPLQSLMANWTCDVFSSEELEETHCG